MNYAVALFVIWKWTSDSFIGVWKLQSNGQKKFINMMPGGMLKTIGSNHSTGYWEKTNNEIHLGISNYGNWKLYKGSIHKENQTSATIQGNVLSGQNEPFYEGTFEMEPTFLQFHNIKYEKDDEEYYNNTIFHGFWLLENSILTTNYKTEKGNNRMRKHIIKKLRLQEHSRIINIIQLKDDNTWQFYDSNFEIIETTFKGVWGMYNDTDTINFNSAIKYQFGKGIWLKSNQFEKVYILTNVSYSNFLSGISVHSYGFEPTIDDTFFMKKISNLFII